MSRRAENIEMCKRVLQCHHCGECSQHAAIFGEEQDDGGVVLPSPHIGGPKIDDYCIYILGQNPGQPKEGEPKFHADSPEGYLMDHHLGLVNEYPPGDFVRDLGLDWDYVVWDNAARCHTEDNEMNNTLFENCSEWTREQLSILDPDYIIAMGSWAAKEFFGWRYGDIEENHAAMYHYAYMQRQGTYERTVKKFRSFAHPHLPDKVLQD